MSLNAKFLFLPFCLPFALFKCQSASFCFYVPLTLFYTFSHPGSHTRHQLQGGDFCNAVFARAVVGEIVLCCMLTLSLSAAEREENQESSLDMLLTVL